MAYPTLVLNGSVVICQIENSNFNGVLSEKRKIICGVPQGSLLGPLLFILYINDLYKTSNNLTFVLFADDTNVFLKGSQLDHVIDCLNIELNKIAKWFDANQLSLNIRKTQYMIFSNMYCNTSKDVTIKGIKLEQVNLTKFLGVYIDNKLTWKEHIRYTKNKISRCIGILSKVNKVLSKKVKLHLYKTFVQPHLIYCNIVWGCTYKSVLQPLIIAQKRALKMALNLPRETASDVVFSQAAVHDLMSINKIQTAILMYKYSNNLLPNSFVNKFQTNKDYHTYNTRSSTFYHVPLIRLEKMKMSMDYRGVTIWNSIGDKLRSLETLQGFKNSIKKYFVYKR